MTTTTLRCNDTCCRPEYEGPEVVNLGTTSPKARKEHKCDACGDPITVGTRYDRVAAIVDGEFSVEKMHVASGACAWG